MGSPAVKPNAWHMRIVHTMAAQPPHVAHFSVARSQSNGSRIKINPYSASSASKARLHRGVQYQQRMGSAAPPIEAPARLALSLPPVADCARYDRLRAPALEAAHGAL